ncbi:YkvA family protein [Streptosporangium amethystogenes]|uniref:YkvA family protein n=1 Tax=Streptosporangium amethystogenes TaxID=2002 RepID=UPI0006915A4A|nr:YkvA family protein [Streptosporangium amethystogenes]
MNTWITSLLGALAGLVLLWLALVAALAVARPRGNALGEALRLLPDLLRLIPRLARDGSLPRGVRIRLWLLLGYLAMPIDLVPDFVPVLGYADDAIIVALVLRSVTRRAGEEAVTRHWPGTAEGLRVVRRLARIPAEPDARGPETEHHP